MEDVAIESFAQNFLNPSGREGDQSTVKFGSGAGPRFCNVCRTRNAVLDTSVRPSVPIPPIDSVVHTGSPVNKLLYSWIRAKRTMRNFIMK